MDLDDLDRIARRKKERIEELLRQMGGRVQRASELSSPSATKGLSLDEVLPDACPLEGCEGVRRRTSQVVIGAPSKKAHPRGYVFRPEPDWKRLGAARVEPDCLAILANGTGAACEPVALERLAFVDTETTGVAGNTGTYAFLVGLGYFCFQWPRGACAPRQATFVCEQYFMEDYPHEPALLEMLAERLRAFDILVTFNGLAYDVPLLETRARLNRMRLALPQVHIDLLQTARKVWRRRLRSCGLSSLERHILGVERMHDVSGAEIPAIYFNHLRGLGRERLVPVFDHNVQDIVSLGALLLHFLELMRDPDHEGLAHGADAFGIGALHAARGAAQRALAYFARAAELGLSDVNVREITRYVLRVCRETGAHAEGLAFLETLRKGFVHEYPQLYNELAKWYERIMCEPERALAVIEEAQRQARFELELGLGNAQRRLAWDRVLAELAKRRRRIEKRLGR